MGVHVDPPGASRRKAAAPGGPVLAGQRWWRTGDGRLVGDGDPAAETLAYAAGDPVAEADQAAVAGPVVVGEAGPEPEVPPQPAAKVRRPTRNK